MWFGCSPETSTGWVSDPTSSTPQVHHAALGAEAWESGAAGAGAMVLFVVASGGGGGGGSFMVRKKSTT